MAQTLLLLLIWQPTTAPADTIDVRPFVIDGTPGVWMPRHVAEFYLDRSARIVPLQALALTSMVAAYDSVSAAMRSRHVEVVLLRSQVRDAEAVADLARRTARVHQERAATFQDAWRRERRRSKIMQTGGGTLIVAGLVVALVL